MCFVYSILLPAIILFSTIQSTSIAMRCFFLLLFAPYLKANILIFFYSSNLGEGGRVITDSSFFPIDSVTNAVSKWYDYSISELFIAVHDGRLSLVKSFSIFSVLHIHPLNVMRIIYLIYTYPHSFLQYLMFCCLSHRH